MKSRTEIYNDVVQQGADAYFRSGKTTIEAYVHAMVFLYDNQAAVARFIEGTDGIPPMGTNRLEDNVVGYLKYSFEGGAKPQWMTYSGL